VTSNPITDVASRVYANLGDPQTLARARDRSWLVPLWQSLEEAGLPLAWVPEDRGGSGAAVADGFEIAHVSGTYASPAPVAETLLAGWLLARAGIDCPAGMMTIAPARQRGSLELGRDGLLAGRARGVPSATDAKHIAVFVDGPDGAKVALVPAQQCRMSVPKGLTGIPVADVTVDGVRPITTTPAPHGLNQATLMQMGAALRAMEAAGALEAILELSKQYAQERVAFGKPIGKFQAIQHSLARLAGEVAAALSAAGSAADAIASVDGDPQRFDEGIYLEVAAARVRTAEAATEGAAIAHQIFGAIGFTQEHALNRYTLRLLGWRDDFGNESQWAAELGTRIAAKGADELWPLLASR
jgi:acyl-CoA dehydrogenase